MKRVAAWKIALASAALALAADAASAHHPPPPVVEDQAAEGGESDQYSQAVAAMDAGEYERALDLFGQVVAAEPDNAAAYTNIGYIHRRLQNFDLSLANYHQALAIDPEFTSAHEYIGEAYLEIDNLEMAEYHLRKLDLICLFGCQDYDDLLQAVELYRANAPARKPTS